MKAVQLVKSRSQQFICEMYRARIWFQRAFVGISKSWLGIPRAGVSPWVLFKLLHTFPLHWALSCGDNPSLAVGKLGTWPSCSTFGFWLTREWKIATAFHSSESVRPHYLRGVIYGSNHRPLCYPSPLKMSIHQVSRQPLVSRARGFFFFSLKDGISYLPRHACVTRILNAVFWQPLQWLVYWGFLCRDSINVLELWD